MLNLTIGLFGIHYNPNYRHWMNWNIHVDWKRSLQNNRNFLYGDNEIKMYSATYFSSKIDELNNDFYFHKLLLKEFNTDKPPSLSRNETFLDTLHLLKDTDTSVIMTRYDLLWNTNPLHMIREWDKINVICGAKWGDDHDLVDDNFYYIPNHLLQDFTIMVENNLENHSHTWHKYIPMNKIDDTHYYSHEIPHYTINRG